MKNIKLLEVTGYYQEGDNFNFVEEKSWKGKVVLREDLTFKGIVVDNSTHNNFDHLLYGTLLEYKGTSLIKLSNQGLCPCSFFGMSNGKEMLGKWAVHIYFYGKNIQGRCKIIFAEIPAEEEVVSDILQRIEKFEAEMDNYSRKCYESLIDNMSSTAKRMIQNMNEHKDEIERELGCTLKKLEI